MLSQTTVEATTSRPLTQSDRLSTLESDAAHALVLIENASQGKPLAPDGPAYLKKVIVFLENFGSTADSREGRELASYLVPLSDRGYIPEDEFYSEADQVLKLLLYTVQYCQEMIRRRDRFGERTAAFPVTGLEILRDVAPYLVKLTLAESARTSDN